MPDAWPNLGADLSSAQDTDLCPHPTHVPGTVTACSAMARAIPYAANAAPSGKPGLTCSSRAGRVTDGEAYVGQALLKRLGQDGRCDPSHQTLAKGQRRERQHRQASAEGVLRLRHGQLGAPALAQWHARVAGHQRLPADAGGGAEIPSRSLRSANWPSNLFS